MFIRQVSIIYFMSLPEFEELFHESCHIFRTNIIYHRIVVLISINPKVSELLKFSRTEYEGFLLNVLWHVIYYKYNMRNSVPVLMHVIFLIRKFLFFVHDHIDTS